MGKLIAVLVSWLAVSPLAAVVLARGMRPGRSPVATPPTLPSPSPVAPTRSVSPEVAVVTAHGLTRSCDVVIDAAETLRENWAVMAPTQRDDVLATVLEQAQLVREVLAHVTDGVADHIRQALDDLERPVSLPAAVDGAAARP